MATQNKNDNSNSKMYNTHTDIIKNFNSKKLHEFLFVSKVILIVLTVFWFLFFIVMTIIEKFSKNIENTEKYKNWKKKLTLINSIFFYIIVVFVCILCFIILRITFPSWRHIFRIPTFNNKKQNMNPFKQKENYVSIPEEQLSFTLSLNWWMILYLLIITIAVTYAKIKHDPTLIYNLF